VELEMKTMFGIVATLSCVMCFPGVGLCAVNDATEQQPLPKYLSPAEVSKDQKSERLKENSTPILKPASPKALPGLNRAKRSNPVFVGGPSNLNKNVAVSGKLSVPKNAAAIGGNNVSRGQN
jgi:hypothetical protein